MRFAFSTLLGLSLTGFCLGSAQAQTEMKKTKAEKREMKRERKREAREAMENGAMMGNHMTDEGMMEDYMMDEAMMAQPVPIGYPFAAPGGLHLYHYTDSSMEAVGEGSSYMKKMDNRWHHEMMMHDRMMREEAMMTENEKEMMMMPTPIGYPFAAPAGLHLYHYTDFSHEAVAEGSSSMKQMDKMESDDNMKREQRKWYGNREVDENDMTMEEEMKEPAPIGYPFAAPGGLHLYHYTDYSMEGVGEGSAAMKKADNMEMRDKKMKKEKMPK